MVFTANVVASCGSSVRAAALAGAGPQTSGCRRACPAGCVPNLKSFVILNEAKNLFPLRTKGRLRTLPSKEEKDKRSAVKNLSTYTSIQILRRYAPQNDNAVIPYWLRYGMSSKILARAGCGGRIFDASRPRAHGLPYQKEPAGHACHNCHSEQSGSTNAASAEAACRLCLARRKKTNEVQSRIYSGQGYRCFAALNMTVAAALRKEVNDKRSAVKHLYRQHTDSSSLCSSE